MTRLGAAFFIALALWLSGCAQGVTVSGPASGFGASVEMATESDEPPQRRRARLRTELAAAYFQQGQNLVALDEIKQALLADPAYADAYNLRGLVFLRLNDLPMAGESFQRAVTLRPGDPDALHNMGWLLCQQSRFEESDKLFAQALAQPRYAQPGKTRVVQGLCQLRDGKPSLAEASWLQALALDADNPAAAYQLSQLYFKRGDFQLAQPYMRKLNGGRLANAESLWLGIRIERQLNQPETVATLAGLLRIRFAQSRELIAFDKGVFHE
jgi:type IV pilus assembly protein PilF